MNIRIGRLFLAFHPRSFALLPNIQREPCLSIWWLWFEIAVTPSPSFMPYEEE